MLKNQWLPTLAFIAFATLIGFRDILSELFLREDPISFAFLVCATIAGISTATILVKGDGRVFLEKLQRPKALKNALLLGFCSTLVYGVTFLVIKKMGAGLFNLIEYGLSPILTLALGVLFFKEKLKVDFFVAFACYLVGIVFLFSGKPTFGMNWIGVAMISPFACAAADGLTKWFLEPECGNLNRSELLVVRFFPASVLLFGSSFLYATSPGIHFYDFLSSLSVAVFCGYLPLFLLCTGLGRKGLSEYAVWLFLIPGVAFFGTLHTHLEEHARPLPIVGALLVLMGILVVEFRLGQRLIDQITLLLNRLNRGGSKSASVSDELYALQRFSVAVAQSEREFHAVWEKSSKDAQTKQVASE